MVVFRNDHSDPFSLSNNRITALELDDNRNGLWIGTQRGGLNFLDLVSGKFHRIHILGEAQAGLEILSITIIGGRDLWVGTQRGLYTARLGQAPDNLKFRPVLPGKRAMVEAVYQDKNAGIWVGTRDELLYKPPGKAGFKRLHQGDVRGVYSITPYDEGNVLVGSVVGLFMIDLESFSLRKLNDLKVTSLLVDKPNSIWVGTTSNGLFNCDANGQVSESYDFEQTRKSYKYKVSHIYKDRSSSLFISTLGAGIKVFNKHSHTFKSYPQNVTKEEFLRLKHPLCFYADNNETLYIGIRNNGLAVYDRTRHQVRFHQLQTGAGRLAQNKDVTALFKDRNQKLWIGKGDGICVVNKADLTHPQG